MEQDSFSLRSTSPVLSRAIKNHEVIQTRSNNKLNLEDLHKHLHQHLTKKLTIPRAELKAYFEQVNRMNPDDQTITNRRLLMKIRGLLSYMLKKRTDFQCSIASGVITILEKSASEEVKSANQLPTPPKFYSQPSENSLASDLLTNNDFLTMTPAQNSQKMELESSYNYSADLFPDSIEALHSYSQENYQMLRRLTNKSEQSSCDDGVFKVPPPPPPPTDNFENAYKIHDALDENYNSLSQSLQDGAAADVHMGESHHSLDGDNLFDDLSISNDELKEDFEVAHEQLEKWMSDLAHDLVHLQVNDNYTFNSNVGTKEVKGNTKMDDSSSSSSVPISPHYSEENLKIIREVCSEFKKDLEEMMKTDKSLEVLRELLDS